MPPKYTDEQFLGLCLQNLKTEKIDVDFKLVGAALGITAHSAYCHMNKLQKKWKAEASKQSGGSESSKATTGATPKKATPKRAPRSAGRKRVAMDDDDDGGSEDQTPCKRAKTEAVGGKGVAVKAEWDDGAGGAGEGAGDDGADEDFLV